MRAAYRSLYPCGPHRHLNPGVLVAQARHQETGFTSNGGHAITPVDRFTDFSIRLEVRASWGTTRSLLRCRSGMTQSTQDGNHDQNGES